MRTVLLCLVMAFATTVANGAADDLVRATPAFDFLGSKAVPVDFQTVDLTMTFDVATKQVLAQAIIDFDVDAGGYPYFDMVPAATSLELDGVQIAADQLQQTRDPGNVTFVRILKQQVAANSSHRLVINYRLPTAHAGFPGDGTVAAGFFMSDLATGGREFWEQYAPSNIEFDQFQQTMHVKITGTDKAHTLFANGVMTNVGENAWTIQYPDYFTTSSFYFHLAAVGRYQVRTGNYTSINGATIPVTSYAESASNADRGLSNSIKILGELERTYGAYAHASLTAYITPGGGGMEHCGATMTSLSALGHELTHSWFARGVMPANGNAGWIDEATASWRDGGYSRAGGAPNRSPVNLGGFAAFRRHTTMDAYSYGKTLMTEFDFMFREFSFEGQSGMRAVLRKLFGEKQRQTITVGYFQEFLETTTGMDLDRVFNRYVFGRNSEPGEPEEPAEPTLSMTMDNTHPRPFTKEERVLLR